MNEMVKWTYWILLLMLVIALIDLNVNSGKKTNGQALPIGTINLVLGGAIVLLAIFGWILKKLNK